MQKSLFLALLTFGAAFVLANSPAQANSRHHHVSKQHHAFNTTHTRQARLSRSGNVHRKYAHRKHAHRKYAKRSGGGSVSLAGVTPVLAAKARQIVASCGSAVISGVSARGNRSNHPIGRAVDLRGNPGCIYAQLKGWPGGYSTDYASAGHVHISYNPGGQEWGLRFAHGGHRHNTYRTARAYGVRTAGRYAARGVVYRNAYGFNADGSNAYAMARHRPQ
jgi:hypothetical protein